MKLQGTIIILGHTKVRYTELVSSSIKFLSQECDVRRCLGEQLLERDRDGGARRFGDRDRDLKYNLKI